MGANLLARADAKILLMVGAGALAPQLIGVHRAVRARSPASWSGTAARPRRDRLLLELAGAASGRAGPRPRGCGAPPTWSRPRRSVRSPWCAASGSGPEPHVDLVGADTPAMREADDEAMRRARLHLDYQGSKVEEAGDLVQPLASGAITRQGVLGDLFDLCQGRAPGRPSADEITLLKNGGGSHLDLFTAEFPLRRLDGEA